MTRLHIDWDGDGAYAVLTRPGEAAEIVRLRPADVDRLVAEVMTAALAERGRVVVTPARWPSEDTPEPLIGQWGE